MSQADPIPRGMHTVTPHLVCSNAATAFDLYKRAFNAEELARAAAPDGKIMHGLIRIGDSMIMLVDEFPQWGSLGPAARGGSSVTMHLYVEDADKLFNQAVEAGCSVQMPMADMFWGDRYGVVKDPFGHSWAIATHMRDVSPEEIQQAISQMSKDCGPQS